MITYTTDVHKCKSCAVLELNHRSVDILKSFD